MPKKIQGAIAAFSVLALLTACTPSSSDPDATRKDAKTAEAAADPVFRVGAITNDSAETAAEAAPSSPPTDEATSTAAPSASAPAAIPTGDAFGEVVESGDELDLEAGQRIGIAVENATLTDVSVTEQEHPRITADPGTFFDVSGTTLDTDDDAQAGSSTPTSTSSEPSDSSSSEAASGETKDKDGAEAVTAPAESAAWISRYDLVADSEYTVEATATTPDGDEAELKTTVAVGATTAAPMSVRTTLADDQTVGVAAPIILSFGSTVSEDFRDDVERRLSVKVTDKDGKERKVEGSWGWLYDDPQSRLHFRPKEFWPAHSKVSVDVPLKNVPTGENSVGQNDLTLDFEIGRKQVVEASAKTHRMVVTRDGKEVMDFPASLGAPKSPSYNGTHVVMSKAADYTMKSEQWDYETDVQWAVRIHNNGEFIHAAPWSTGVQGSQNVSHGCINLSTQRAKQYFDSAIFGDPVEITGSHVSLSTQDSDISDWVYSWKDWQKLSALD